MATKQKRKFMIPMMIVATSERKAMLLVAFVAQSQSHPRAHGTHIEFWLDSIRDL
jgi:hypothetical protein